MTQYDNTNRGSIWGNDKKEKDTHPDFKGSINVEGVEYWLSGWKRKPDANPKAPALSLSVQRKDSVPNTETRDDPFADSPKPSQDFDDSSIPF